MFRRERQVARSGETAKPHCISNVRGKITASGCKAEKDDCLERDKDDPKLEVESPRNVRLAVNRKMGKGRRNQVSDGLGGSVTKGSLPS